MSLHPHSSKVIIREKGNIENFNPLKNSNLTKKTYFSSKKKIICYFPDIFMYTTVSIGGATFFTNSKK